MLPTVTIIIFAFGTFIAWCGCRFLNGLKQVNYIPGYRVLFTPVSLLGSIFPSCFWNLGRNWAWSLKGSAYFNYNHDIISIVPFFNGESYFFTCSVDVLKQLLGNEHKTHLTKPPELTSAPLWGHSITSASGSLWQKHRRAVAPAFQNSLINVVRSETTQVYQEMLEAKGWTTKNQVFISDVKDVLANAVLVVLGRCGFGFTMPWPKEDNDTDLLSKEMSLADAIRIVAATFTLRFVMPTWAYKLPIKGIKTMGNSWDTMITATTRFVLDQRSSLNITGTNKNIDRAEGGYILHRLIEASNQDSGKYWLDEKETVANMFTLLIAGHETTSSVLTATLGFLAVYQDEQEKAYQEVSRFVSKNGKIDIKEMESTPHLFACFLEAGRRYPAAFILPRIFTEDTTVKVKRPKEETVILPKGSGIIFDLISIFNNPLDFPEPHIFKPSRWYGVPESDYNMFGAGPRTCIGRKFAFTESVNLLAHILYDWKLDVKLEDGETRGEYEKRVMGNAIFDGTAFSVGQIGLNLTRRSNI